MPKFKVIAAFTTYGEMEIEAEDYNDAYTQAKEADGVDFISIDADDKNWPGERKIKTVTLIPKKKSNETI